MIVVDFSEIDGPAWFAESGGQVGRSWGGRLADNCVGESTGLGESGDFAQCDLPLNPKLLLQYLAVSSVIHLFGSRFHGRAGVRR